MTNNMRPIHPGEILREEYLNELGMSANALSIALRVPSSRIDQIIKEKRPLSPDKALRLAKYFGGDAQSWLNLQTTYDLKRTESKFGSLIDSEVQPMASGQ
tara:strand:- start:6611 stop:6913 length:303 start_codon:yes stop_codon:yes gene_type:complete